MQVVLGRLDYKYGGGAGTGGQVKVAVQPPVRVRARLCRPAGAVHRPQQKCLQVYCQKQRLLCRKAVRLMGGEPEV